MSEDFLGKVAIVTGAARGIGEAIARDLAAKGATVVLSDRLEADGVVQEIREQGGAVSFHAADVTDAGAMNQLVEQTAARHGSLDLFVAAAAFSLRGPFYEQPLEDARQTLDVTLWGGYLSVRAASQQMVRAGKGGVIIVIGSPHAIIPVPECMAYNMAKAGLDMMAKTAAAELLDHGVRVNIVHPGWTDTPGERRYFTEEEIAERGKLIPTGRLARPDEIARAVSFLASDESVYINGSTLTVDGGLQLPRERNV